MGLGKQQKPAQEAQEAEAGSWGSAEHKLLITLGLLGWEPSTARGPWTLSTAWGIARSH
jgi:hypothetical protein